MQKNYYHVSDIRNKRSILRHGLLANKYQQIFLFDTLDCYTFEKLLNISESIAMSQLFSSHYSLFCIDARGLNRKLKSDNVGECTACFQWMLKGQKVIE